MPQQHSRIITLLTDFGVQDAYTGIMKGVIAGINPHASVIDLCHAIPPQDVFRGAYLLYTSYSYFPKGTIHVAVIDPGVGSERNVICVECNDYLFLIPDNGLLSFILQEEEAKNIIRVTNTKFFLPKQSNTFHGRDIFAPVAAHLSLGILPAQLGENINQICKIDIPNPVFAKERRRINGTIISIDHFGNIITNITEKHLADLRTTAKDLIITIGTMKIRGLNKTYAEVKAGMPLALIGSAGFLEISLNQGNAQKYFKVKQGQKVCIDA
ncbi:MAG: SAM-dependent chlorinase/fluorinase [Candidatus Kuenenia sp.]|nr:SAM-dependent chlorinase/fluorinase [Candidatus Kuenenia hertensis]